MLTLFNNFEFHGIERKKIRKEMRKKAIHGVKISLTIQLKLNVSYLSLICYRDGSQLKKYYCFK